MFMIWKSILKRKTTWVLVVIIPILFGLVIYPTIKDTVSQVSVPITVVDQTDQEITDELLNEIDEEPFQVSRMDTLDLRYCQQVRQKQSLFSMTTWKRISYLDKQMRSLRGIELKIAM